MTINEALRLSTGRLEGRFEAPRLEAELLLVSLLNLSRAQILAHPERNLDPREERRFLNWLELRSIDFPLQYLRGYESFYGRRFQVNREVLIPRPETELLVEATLQVLTRRPEPLRIADVGTGSGCIAVTLACEMPALAVLACDIHLAALRIARANCRLHQCEDRIQLACGDELRFLRHAPHFDLIVSNPPYVRSQNPSGLQSGVSDFEPHLALFGGVDGLDFYRRLLTHVPLFLKENGNLAVEIGFDQQPALTQLAGQTGWAVERIIHDLAGHPRCILLGRK